MVSQSINRAGSRALKLLITGVLAVCLSFMPLLIARTAAAEGTIRISTLFTGITIKAGKTTNYTMKVTNDSSTSQNIDLEVQAVPANWSAYFSGGGNPVSSVFVDANTTETITFLSRVPEDTPEGQYFMYIKATGENGDSYTLKLEVNVSEKEVTTDAFTSQYTSLGGSVSTSFKFSSTIYNRSSEDRAYSLSASAPAGWTVAFTPAYQTQQVSSFTVNNLASQGIDITVTPANTATAGTYPITCTVASDTGEMTLDLSVTITGSYKIAVSTQSGALNADAFAGKETSVPIVIYNTGTTDLSEISLAGYSQSGWPVRFDPDSVDTIAAGDTKQVMAYISVPADTVVGDYIVSISASSQETSGNASITVAVKASTTWGIVAIIIILLLVAGLIMVFLKFGRR